MNFVAISADGRIVASNGNVPGTDDAALGLWTFPAGDFLRSVAGHPVAISADFRYLANEAGVLDLQTGAWIFQLSRPPDFLRAAAFSPDGDAVAIVAGSRAGARHHAQITVQSTADRSRTTSFGSRYAQALAFHPDGETLASGHWNNVTLWHARTGVRQALLRSPQRTVDPTSYHREGRYITGVAFSPDGEIVAAGSDDGELQIWNVGDQTLRHSLNIGWSDVSKPAFSPDGTLVAAGTYADGTASLVEVASGAILSRLQVSMFGCGSVAFSLDGRYLVAPSNGGLLANGTYDHGGSIRVLRVTP